MNHIEFLQSIEPVSEKTITISIGEYQSLIKCQAWLDLFLSSSSKSGFLDSALVASIIVQRKAQSHISPFVAEVKSDA